jgi:glycerol uptake facilitator-like aquaporin
MLAAEKSKTTFIAPIGIGMALFVTEIAGVYYTGGSLNPARSFAPCVASWSFESYHWSKSVRWDRREMFSDTQTQSTGSVLSWVPYSRRDFMVS